MARLARVVVPGYPHHVTQRGSRSQATFLRESDYATYHSLLTEETARIRVEIWAYCLMPNHVHLVAVPSDGRSLSNLLQRTHWRHACAINQREGWRGHLWQERFHSFPMDEAHLRMAVRYVELNPVRAGLCRRAADWRWSSVHAHLRTSADPLVNPQPMLDRIRDWTDYLETPQTITEVEAMRRHGATGRPAGSALFVDELERISGRSLRPGRRGPKPGPAVGRGN